MELDHSAVKALKAMYENKIGDRLKAIESTIERQVLPSQAFVIRLDGVAFHTFLKGVKKPFDHRITDAMVKTTADLVEKFRPSTGYTSSDEISLIFPAQTGDLSISKSHPLKKQKKESNNVNDKVHAYNGRIQKLASVTSGYASARFNYHLNHPMDQWDDNPTLKSKMLNGNGYFDSRVIIVESLQLIMECVYWRSNFDAFRNAISQISMSNFSHKQLHGKSVVQQLNDLNDIGINVLDTFHPRYLFGSWVKRDIHMIDAIDFKTKQPVQALRSRQVCGSFNWSDWSEQDRIDFLLSAYWNNGSDQNNSPPIDVEYTSTLFVN